MNGRDMSRLGVALRMEWRLQYRYHLLHAAALSGVLWLAMLLPMRGDLRSLAEPYVILGDLTIVGFFFIAGAVFFEKGDRTLDAVVSSPLRFHEYLASKVLTLTGVSTVIVIFIATVTHGFDYSFAPLVLGAVLGTMLMLLVGFITAMPFTSVSDWFMPAVLPIALFNLPAVHYSGLWETPLSYLIPTHGPLLLLGVGFDQKAITWWQAGYAVLYPLLAGAGLWLLARRMFDKYLVAKIGSA